MDVAALTVGVEEEFLLVDPETGEVTPAVEAVVAAIADRHQARACPEFHRSQLELATTAAAAAAAAAANTGAAANDVATLRQRLAKGREGQVHIVRHEELLGTLGRQRADRGADVRHRHQWIGLAVEEVVGAGPDDE